MTAQECAMWASLILVSFVLKGIPVKNSTLFIIYIIENTNHTKIEKYYYDY